MGFEGFPQSRDPAFALWADPGHKTTALPSRQSLSAPGPAPRSRAHCPSLADLSLASNPQRPPHSHSSLSRTPSGHRQIDESRSLNYLGIQSQLANNLEDSSAKCTRNFSAFLAFLCGLRPCLNKYICLPRTWYGQSRAKQLKKPVVNHQSERKVVAHPRGCSDVFGG